jgi:hypothetical protein
VCGGETLSSDSDERFKALLPNHAHIIKTAARTPRPIRRLKSLTVEELEELEGLEGKIRGGAHEHAEP